MAAKSDFASTLHRMLASLAHLNDPLWLISTEAGAGQLKIAGISKGETVLVSIRSSSRTTSTYSCAKLANLQRLVRKKSGLFDEGDIVRLRVHTCRPPVSLNDLQVSNRLLISQALVVVSPSAHNISHLPSLLHSLPAEMGLLPTRVAAYTSGLSLFPPQGPSSYVETPSILHLDHCLRLLDTCLLGSWSVSGEESVLRTQKLIELRESGFIKSVFALCVSCDIISRDNSLEDHRATGE